MDLQELRISSFHPVLGTLFWCSFLFNGGLLILESTQYLSAILFCLLLILLLVFKIKERVAFGGDELIVELQRAKARIPLKEIEKIKFLESYSEIEIVLKTGSILNFDIRRFERKEIESYFSQF